MQRKSTIIILACAVTAFAVSVWFLGGRAIVSEGVYPVEKASLALRTRWGARLRVLWRRQNYAEENRRLKRENDILKMRLAAEQASDATRDPMPPDIARRWLPADILSRGGPSGARNFLRLSIGSIDGVVEGAPVAVPEGLVGRITAVSPHTSVVTFLTDPSIRVSCALETGDESFGAVYGIVSGTGARKAAETEAVVLYVVNPLRIRHLGRDFVAPPRTRLVTTGFGGVYPAGLAIGYLLDGVHDDPTSLEREGDVMPAVDFPALERVFVLRK